MAAIGNDADTLLHGLSDFWLRYFRDIGDLQGLYEGTEILLGQAYLDLLTNVLNRNTQNIPLFNKNYYSLVTIREDKLKWVENSTFEDSGYLFETIRYGALPSLQNKIFAPTAALENELDYHVLDKGILFKDDPTNPPLNGYAQRPIDVLTGGFFKDDLITNWATLDVKKGDSIELNAPGRDTQLLRIIHVASDKLSISSETPVPTLPAGLIEPVYTWQIKRVRTDGTEVTGLPGSTTATGHLLSPDVIRLYEVTFWAVDAAADMFGLYETYGHLFSEQRYSTESYRAFIRGLMQLYALGPAMDRVESAMNVIAGLPVIREDGEILTSYDPGLDGVGTDGSVTGQTFLSPSFTFTVGHVGGYIDLRQAVFNDNRGVYKILAVNTPHEIVLNKSINFTDETSIDWQFSVKDLQTITTNKNTYTYSRYIPLRSDVTDPSQYGALTFRAFEPLTIAIQIVDHLKDPTWWYNITIPEELMPNADVLARTVTPELFPLQFGPTGRWRFGDLNVRFGAAEDGTARPNVYKHCAAFELMDRYLKHHMFCVRISNSVEDPRIDDITRILREQKPAYTTIYFQFIP